MFRVTHPTSLLGFLKKKTSLSGRHIKRSLEGGGCLLNGKIERFGSVQVERGDQVMFRSIEKRETPSLSILYQDPCFTIFLKPSGVISALVENHWLVHRLDKGTSGVFLMARTWKMKKALESLFKQRKIKKIYIALIKGCPRKPIGTITDCIGKIGAFQGQTLYGTVLNGKQAITHYRVLKKGNQCSLIELHPETGRTHQLRVHLSALGHPILGDGQYGRSALFSSTIPRLCLHAYRLTFFHPNTGKKVEVTASVPDLFKNEDFNC